MTKREQLTAWLAENPGKTKEDWLLEVRCGDDATREEFKAFLKFCDENGIALNIPSYGKWINYKSVEFDFEVKNFGSYYDLDTPDELYTGKSGFNEAGWMPFLDWKLQQVMAANPEAEEVDGFVTKVGPGQYEIGRGDITEMEKSFPFFVNTKSLKWNNPEVLDTLKKWSKG